MKIQIKSDQTPALVVTGGLLFTLLFWNEGLGLNLLIYSLFIWLGMRFNSMLTAQKQPVFYAITHLVCAAMVVVNHSELSLFAYYLSLFVWVGRTHYPLLRTAGTALFTGLLRFLLLPFTLFQRLKRLRIGGFAFRPLIRPLKYLVLPAFAVFVFTLIYAAANAQFAALVSVLIDSVGQIIDFLSEIISVRVFHILAGMIVTAALLLTYEPGWAEHAEDGFSELLQRRGTVTRQSLWRQAVNQLSIGLTSRNLALKTELINAKICLVLLNLLLLVLNVLDLKNVWFSGTGPADPSAELHDGTNALIISIVLAMAIIIFFFRGNLNFYRNNGVLKMLAYAWIAQNAFLILSVTLRDLNYISLYGLTYKRIGVGFFLLLCCAGLATVYIKVAARRTFFYLYRLNGFIWLLLLAAASVVNWDVLIVRYNVSHAGRVSLDVDHLMGLSDKALPALHANRQLLMQHVKTIEEPQHRPNAEHVVQRTPDEAARNFSNRLEEKTEGFYARQAGGTWLSWNLPDQQTKTYLNGSK
ncbi:hypothetical protein C7T94_14990 [Pedobacter yulinensis]|uniref:Uncharacterized protein n=1 Tax=Pedobacter yulinensis TaxID=2126353 RepID=A0A2T3HI41_9SPHI|nr:DUF4173 domain-containing protein [Pedobacter yulinensis]PST82109.1 hypothetical protein C7T94_14990 [Pedobacter yulinensis]